MWTHDPRAVSRPIPLYGIVDYYQNWDEESRDLQGNLDVAGLQWLCSSVAE